MRKLLIALAAAAIGMAAMSTALSLQPSRQAAADLGHSILAGLILGSGVWPYGTSPVPAALQASLWPGSQSCDWQSHCDDAGGTVLTERQDDFTNAE